MKLLVFSKLLCLKWQQQSLFGSNLKIAVNKRADWIKMFFVSAKWTWVSARIALDFITVNNVRHRQFPYTLGGMYSSQNIFFFSEREIPKYTKKKKIQKENPTKKMSKITDLFNFYLFSKTRNGSSLYRTKKYQFYGNMFRP